MESSEGLKGTLETKKGTLRSKGLRVNVNKTIMFNCERARKVKKESFLAQFAEKV